LTLLLLITNPHLLSQFKLPLDLEAYPLHQLRHWHRLLGMCPPVRAQSPTQALLLRLNLFRRLLICIPFNTDSLTNLVSSLNLGKNHNLDNSFSQLRPIQSNNLNPTSNSSQLRSLSLVKKFNLTTNLRSSHKSLHGMFAKLLAQAPHLNLDLKLDQ